MLIEIEIPDEIIDLATAEAERRGISLNDLIILGLQTQIGWQDDRVIPE